MLTLTLNWYLNLKFSSMLLYHFFFPSIDVDFTWKFRNIEKLLELYVWFSYLLNYHCLSDCIGISILKELFPITVYSMGTYFLSSPILILKMRYDRKVVEKFTRKWYYLGTLYNNIVDKNVSSHFQKYERKRNKITYRKTKTLNCFFYLLFSLTDIYFYDVQYLFIILYSCECNKVCAL